MAQEIYHRSEWGNPNEQWGNVYLNADLTNELYKRASEYENSWVTDQLLNGVGTKPSIILTPTAYEDGILNSVKPAKTLGSELVTNGTFDADLSGWTNSNNHWQWTSQGAYFPLISTHNPLTQILTNPVGVKLKITFTLNIIQGTANFYYYNINNLILAEQYTESGTYTIETELVKQNTNINFSRYGGINTEFYLDNVSVKEIIDADFDFTRGSSATRVNEQGLVEDVQLLSGELVQNGDFEQIGSELVTNGSFETDSDWVKQNGWSIANETAIFSGTVSAYRKLYQENILTIGKIYKLTFDIVSINSGSIKNFSQSSPTSYDTIGTKTEYFTATFDDLFLEPTNDADLTIDNVSVKEVGQNWTFVGTASISDGKATINSPSGELAEIYQSSVLTIGNKYKLECTLDKTSGDTQFVNGGTFILDNGSNTIEFIATDTRVYFKRGAGSVISSIDNISVIEITDDTDLPRINYTNFDYENGEVVPYSGEGSLKLEPQSTNLITYSEDFTEWELGNNSTLTFVSDVVAPDGSLGVYRLQNPSDSGTFLKFGIANCRTFSVYAKAVTEGLNNQFDLFATGEDEDTKTATTEWQRFGRDFGSVSSRTIYINNGSDAYASDIYIWGSQAEALSYATSYIPTNGSTVTRLADLCNNSGSSDLINSTEGVLYAEISALANDNTYRLMSISDGTTANRIVLGYSNGSNLLLVQVFSSGGSQVNFTYSISDITLYNKIALLYKSNEVTIWVNGVKGTSDTSASMPIGLSEFNFNYTYSLPLYGNVKCVAVFKEALSDTELQKLTTI